MGSLESRAERTAQVIWSAWTGGYLLTELPEEIRPADASAGWVAQRALAEHAGPHYGYKIAATSKAGQAHIGVDGPLTGMLFDRFRRDPGAVLPSANLSMRVVEAEFAFRMSCDVTGGATAGEVIDAVDSLHLAIEVPDSRFEHFDRVGEAVLLADVACACWFVLGAEVPGWRELDLRTAETELWINGECTAVGVGGNALGDPHAALVWVASELERCGSGLRAGDVITTGTTTVPPMVGPDDQVRAEFGPLGSVALSFAR
ncbi:MAG: 2-keto-4-pentenoate hydratase [Haloechinothrix sp.]